MQSSHGESFDDFAEAEIRDVWSIKYHVSKSVHSKTAWTSTKQFRQCIESCKLWRLELKRPQRHALNPLISMISHDSCSETLVVLRCWVVERHLFASLQEPSLGNHLPKNESRCLGASCSHFEHCCEMATLKFSLPLLETIQLFSNHIATQHFTFAAKPQHVKLSQTTKAGRWVSDVVRKSSIVSGPEAAHLRQFRQDPTVRALRLTTSSAPSVLSWCSFQNISLPEDSSLA